MSAPRTEPAARWVYEGLWAVLVRWFRVPDRPPDLPAGGGEPDAFRPAMAFLRYLKLWFWIILLIIDVALIVTWIVMLVENALVAWILLPLFLVLIVVPDIFAYVALHLRYDTTWYVLTDRAIRIRRGVWTIHETTITFENIQNVKIQRGPIQRAFGIASVLIETAGAGGGEGKGGHAVSNQGIIEGIDDAPRIRDLILKRLRRSTSAGLGDEDHETPGAGWTPAHLETLRAIRDEIAAMS